MVKSISIKSDAYYRVRYDQAATETGKFWQAQFKGRMLGEFLNEQDAWVCCESHREFPKSFKESIPE